MEDKTKADLTNRLKVAEDYVEKIKAELYAAIGKVSLLKELLAPPAPATPEAPKP